MADKAEKAKNNRKRIFESRRYKIMLWCALVALIVASTATFAWYGANDREADSAPADIMKPYYLNLRNPSDTDDLQLTVGNLFPGDVKQIVFCVSNKNNEKTGLDMGVTSFEYSIELIHTENLALEYRIYELDAATEGESGAIAALDTVTITDEDGSTSEESQITYWKKASDTELSWEDVSDTRHTQVGLTETMPVNAGKYASYTKTSDNTTKLRLEAGQDESGNPTFDSQYFLIEIDWEDGAASKFEQYEKETDMIYLLVEALQPEPQKKDTTETTTE